MRLRELPYWRGFKETGFSPESRVEFPVKGDGRYYLYAIRLSGNKFYHGSIAQLRIDPVLTGQRGARVKIRSVGFVP